MQQSQGAFISFNSFLPTSTKPTVTHTFTSKSMGKPGTVTVLFLMTTDPAVAPMLYAYLQVESEF
jgi:hypothetical protein